MKSRRAHEHRRLLPWFLVLAMLAASCSASTVTVDETTVDSTASTADSQADQEEPAPEDPPADNAADNAADNTDTSAEDATETTDEPDPAPTLTPTDDADAESTTDTLDDTADDTADEADNAATGDEDEATEDDATEDEATTAPSDSTGELGVGDASVVVLDPGSEPRTELRLVIAASCTELMELTTVQEISQVIDGQPIPSAGPIGNIMELATSATPVGDNYEIRSEIVSAAALPNTPVELVEAINAGLSGIVGLAISATLTNRGLQVPGTARVEGAEALGPMAAALDGLNQTQAPLPEEPVGVGARWETRSVIEVEGLLITNITTNELVSVDGTIIEMRATGRQEVDPESRMTTQGITGEVTVWDVTTTGTTTIDLATINPISVSASTVGVQSFDFGLEGQLDQEISTEISSTAEPSDGCTGRSIRG